MEESLASSTERRVGSGNSWAVAIGAMPVNVSAAAPASTLDLQIMKLSPVFRFFVSRH
jgi:hypothetical protein